MTNWYAVYTNPRSEKRVYAELLRKAIEAYLPLQRILKQWSDRKKWVEEPLFRSYLFVHIPPARYFDVLSTPGIVKYVTFEGKAVPVPPKQIDAIRYYLDEKDIPEGEPETALLPGSKVEIIRGPLRGLTGIIINHQGQKRVQIEIEALGQFLKLKISSRDLQAR